MSYGIRFSPEAEETYALLVVQLLQRWGDRFVQKVEIKLSKAIQIIIDNPFFYPVADNGTGIRKCLLHKNCSMLYKVYNNEVLIVCFWDNRQDPLIS